MDPGHRVQLIRIGIEQSPTNGAFLSLAYLAFASLSNRLEVDIV